MREEIFRRRDTPQNKFKLTLFFLILICGIAAYLAEFLKRYFSFLSVFFLLSLIRIKKKYHYFSVYIIMKNIKKILEVNFLDLRVYKTRNNRIISFPKIITKHNEIIIKYDNSISFKKAIDNNIESIGAILPNSWQIKDQYEINNGFKIILKNGEEDRIIINDLNELEELISLYDEGKIPLDKEITLDFNTDPHILVSAKTGAGKTYFIRSLILSLYLHNNRCRIVLNDINQSNMDLYRVCQLNGSKEQIMNNLNQINEELQHRAENFDKIQKFERIVIVLEEYLAFINSLEKKERDEVEKKLKIIAATGRKYKINLIIVTQISSTTEINSGIRSNMTNIILGRLDKSQKLSLSVEAPIQNFGENIPGKASISRDGRFISFLTATVDFNTVLNGIEEKYEINK